MPILQEQIPVKGRRVVKNSIYKLFFGSRFQRLNDSYRPASHGKNGQHINHFALDSIINGVRKALGAHSMQVFADDNMDTCIDFQ